MKPIHMIFLALSLIVLLYVFYPKNVGGPMCGPVCPSVGLHFYSQSCLGFKITRSFIDSFSVDCYGLPVGEKKCYGVPYTNSIDFNYKDSEMDCNYPCDDTSIKDMCKVNTTLDFMGLIVECDRLSTYCNWNQ